ncbi:MAG TPA: asparagine synthase (glutamine-hydrolyzing) [Terriglobia bacterium]|nr:asparagine synthase (glutamine-hydrolyzing) [Terriglobia bacterium]
MCGICGVIGSTDPEPTQSVVRQMMGQMCHRGPDDEGMFVDDSVTLGMRRLSIIDLCGGHQPVLNGDRTVVVVCNGEIYNFQELRHTLESRGYPFRTGSDTEVIVYAYEEWGEDCVDHFEGMFAFALAETSKSTRRGNPRVLLARDRLGIKPLYYTLVDGNLIFASEVRSLLASGQVEPRLSQTALRSYLLFGSVVEPMTLVEGVYSLPPGHRVIISAAGRHTCVHPEPYWDFAASACPALDTKKQERCSATAFLRSLLEETVASHLTADVPVGVFLSSGIDSTALVALAAQKNAALNTVTVVFPEQEFSEAAMARRTARHFGTNHHELIVTGVDLLARLSEAVGALDQPSMDGINTYFVSWAARQAGLKVALSGLGGDEIFGGYSTFRSTPGAQSVASLARTVPGGFRSTMVAAAERVLGRFNHKDAHRKMAALWRDPNFLPHPYFYTRLLFTPSQVLGLLKGNGFDSREPWKDWLEQTALGSKQLDDFTAVSCLESRSYMVDTLLRDTDSMSMAHSLEVRVPFLDHALVEFVSRLPGSIKQIAGVPKSLLVDAVADLLPGEVVSQPKRTFTLPWEHWLRGALRKQMEAELKTLAPPLEQSLRGRAVGRIWSDFLRGQTSWSRVWSLFVLNRWARRHLEN